MAASDNILDDYRKLHTQMLDDIRRWRANGWRLRKDDEDTPKRGSPTSGAGSTIWQGSSWPTRSGTSCVPDRGKRARNRAQLLELMSVPKRLIEVDERTAVAPEKRATERGLSVSAIVAEPELNLRSKG